MNKNHVYRKPETVEEKSELEPEPEKLKKENNNMYRIVGIIDDHYIVNTPEGLKKVKVTKSNKKNVRDEIKIEKL
jgi:hypothetical protein